MSENQAPALPALLQWAVSFLVCLCGVFVWNATFALVGIGIKSFSLPCSMLLSLLVYYFIARRDQRSCSLVRLLLQYIVILLVIVAAGFLVSLVWEYSYWGRGFYTDAIVALADGWNPVYAGSSAVGDLVYQSTKAVWYLDANLYAFFGQYEMAKAHTLLFAVPAYLLAKVCFERLAGGKEKWVRVAVLLSVLNPIALVQVFTFYNDAVLAYCIQCFVLLGYYILNEGYLHGDLLFVLALLWVFILHSQDSGLRAAFVLGIGWMLAVMLLFSKNALRWLSVRAAGVLAFGLLIVGFSPFVKNILEVGMPFAPYIGKNAIDLVSSHLPEAIAHQPKFIQMISSSLLSPDETAAQQSMMLQQIKAFFSNAYASPDAALRGFGFLGGLLILIACVCLLVGFLFYPKLPREANEVDALVDNFDDMLAGEKESQTIVDYIRPRHAMIWLFSTVVLCVLFSPTLWWARSVAVAWFLIPLALVGLHLQSTFITKKVAKVLAGLAILNVLLFGAVALPNDIHYGRSIESYWARMSAEELPNNEDAAMYNQYITQFKTWSEMKQRGNSAVQSRSIWHHLSEK